MMKNLAEMIERLRCFALSYGSNVILFEAYSQI